DNIPLENGIPGVVMQTRQMRLVTDLASEREKVPQPADPALWDESLSTTLSLPLEEFGKEIGALNFSTTKPNGYSREDTKVAITIATHLALSIDRWQQTEQLKKANEELSRLASFPALNPGPIIEADLDGTIYYLNPAGEALFPDCRMAGAQHPLLADLASVAEHLHADGRNAFIREIEIDNVWYQQVFHFVPNTQRIRFYIVDITERRRAEEAVHQQNEYLAALHETTLGLITRLDLNELLQAIVTRASQLLDTAHGFMYLLEAGEHEIEQKVGVGVFEQAIGFRLKPGEGVSGRVWQSGEPLVVTDYDSWKYRAAGFEYGRVRAVTAVPLKSGHQTIGTIGMAYPADSDQVFDEAKIELLAVSPNWLPWPWTMPASSPKPKATWPKLKIRLSAW
ncbi:MAG: GAF domain-containing protein, partial [Anaerolineae bacterium]